MPIKKHCLRVFIYLPPVVPGVVPRPLNTVLLLHLGKQFSFYSRRVDRDVCCRPCTNRFHDRDGDLRSLHLQSTRGTQATERPGLPAEITGGATKDPHLWHNNPPAVRDRTSTRTAPTV